MNLNIKLYCKELPFGLVLKLKERLNQYDMHVDIQPDFLLHNEFTSAYLSFRFSFKEESTFHAISSKELKSGFEFYIEDFNLKDDEELFNPRLLFVEHLQGKRNEDYVFGKHSMISALNECTKQICFIANTDDDIFEMRFASLTSAILTDLTKGICHYPDYNLWYDQSNLGKTADRVFKSIIGYENALVKNEIVFHEFEVWNM